MKTATKINSKENESKERKPKNVRILLQASAGIYGIKTKMRVALITK